MTLLSVRDLRVSYGGIAALKGLSFEVQRGEVVALLGSNGAGKTTTLRAISGLVQARGEILFDGKPVLGKRPDEIVRAGIGHSPEGRRVFAQMTVLENLELGAYSVTDAKIVKERLAYALYTFPRLHERLRQPAGTLSGGEQQMLAIGRALMSGPQLLMLDEPSLGLAPILVRSIFEVIRTFRERGTTVLLVEQNARQALQIADRGYVLETGELRFSGTGGELLDNPAVVEAYLGRA
jgi:branched-chain amino acid transport system ATP-binding protein